MNKNTEYYIKHGFQEMDFDQVRNMLKDAFWSKDIKKDEIMQAAQNSAMVVGTFTKDNKQIGYARVISDKTRYAYISDVMVNENFRKQGIGQAMVKYMMDHPAMKDVYQWTLITEDAHGVYEKLGFKRISKPEDWMEIRNKRPER